MSGSLTATHRGGRGGRLPAQEHPLEVWGRPSNKRMYDHTLSKHKATTRICMSKPESQVCLKLTTVSRIANNRNIEFTSRYARPHAFVTTPRRGLRAGAAVLVVAAPAPLSLIQHGLPEPSRFQAGRRRAAVKTGLRHCTQGAPTEACA